MDSNSPHGLAKIVIDGFAVIVVNLHISMDLVVQSWDEVGSKVKITWSTKETKINHLEKSVSLKRRKEVLGI